MPSDELRVWTDNHRETVALFDVCQMHLVDFMEAEEKRARTHTTTNSRIEPKAKKTAKRQTRQTTLPGLRRTKAALVG